MNDEDAEYEPLMPFLAVASRGGPYDDTAYVAGYELGILDGQLSGPLAPTPEHPGPPAVDAWRWIKAANVEQADLIAMRHGRRLERGERFEDLIAIRVRM